MKPAGLPRLAYLTLLSRPKQDRRIFRMIQQSQVHSILELGIGSGVRTSRMIELLGRQRGSQNPRYIGVDFFEARPANAPGLTIKRAHQLFGNSGVDVRLIPGDPCSVLARTANGLGTIDLVIIGADQDRDSLARAWFYVPRLLGDDSHVLMEEINKAESHFRLVPPLEIADRGRAALHRLRRAA